MVTTERTPFVTLIEPYEWNLLKLAGRQFLIEAFTSDLDRITRTKLFRFRNRSIWLMLLDTRDMLVIHLASWVRTIVDPDGLIAQLQQRHAGDLSRKLAPEGLIVVGEPEWATRSRQDLREREHLASFDRLFPNAGANPAPADFEALRQTFRNYMKPVKDDRNWNRAHPFEKVIGTTKMLSVAKLRGHIDYAERFMNDLRLVGWHGTFGYREMNSPNAADVAPDLVDAMLIGDPERLLKARGTSTREAFYNRLHAEHNARAEAGPDGGPAKGEDYFNDFWRAAHPAVSSAGGS